MALVASGGIPLLMVGSPVRDGIGHIGAATSTLMDAANEACITIGYIITEDGASHTIDTTGSSSLGWRSGSVTFANGTTVVKVGLGTIDTANGPPARATNVANVITFSVSKSHTGGGGGITANAWQENVPDAGTMTVANGDLIAFSIQMTAVAGGDLVNQQTTTGAVNGGTIPSVTGYTGGSYATVASLPNSVITFSDGVRGYFYGGLVWATSLTTQTWNNGSATKEYGNFIQMPFPASIYGITANPAVGADIDFILYDDPLGTPAALKTISVDGNTVGSANATRYTTLLFPAPYSSRANQQLAVIMKPTTTTNVTNTYLTLNISGHQTAHSLGANSYAINRASGAFAAQNSSKDRFSIGLLVGGFDNGSNIVVNKIENNYVGNLDGS